MKEPTSLQENLLYHLGEIGKTLRDQVTKVIREHGYDLSPEQFTILVMLWYQTEMPQAELIHKLNRDKTTVSRVLARMIKNKLITRTSDTPGKKENIIRITPKGKAIQETLIQKTGTIYVQALNGLTPDEIETTTHILSRIYRNLTL